MTAIQGHQEGLARTGERALSDSIPCGIWTVRRDENLTLEYANEYLYQIFGYTAQEAQAIGFHDARFITEPDHWPLMREEVDRQLERGDPCFTLEQRYAHRSGDIRWCMVRGAPVAGDPERLSGVVLDITARKETEQLLRVSREAARLALDRGRYLLATYDVTQRTLLQTRETADWFGTPIIMDEMPQSALVWGMVDPGSLEDFVSLFEYMDAGLPRGEAVIQVKDAQGRRRWVQMEFSLLTPEDMVPPQAVLFFEDVTDRQENLLEYQDWTRRLPLRENGVLSCFEFNLTQDSYCRGSAQLDAHPSGYSDVVCQMAEDSVFSDDVSDFLRTFDRRHLILRYHEGQRDVSLEHRKLGPQGTPIWLEANAHLMLAPDGSGDLKVFIQVRDIHQEKELAVRLKSLSERDPLTGFYNRRAMVEYASQILRDSAPGVCHALLVLDIDQFTAINETYGHHFGDQVIRDLAGKLQSQLRTGDFCGRTGTDEFLLFFREVRGGSNLEPRLEMILRGLTQTYEDGCTASMSLGLSHYPRNGRDFDTLYRKAGLSLQQARKAGTGRYAIYESRFGK